MRSSVIRRMSSLDSTATARREATPPALLEERVALERRPLGEAHLVGEGDDAHDHLLRREVVDVDDDALAGHVRELLRGTPRGCSFVSPGASSRPPSACGYALRYFFCPS